MNSSEDLDGMKEIIIKKKRHNNVLIITSSGGSGHLQAAKAKEQELRKNDPWARVVQRDVLKDWIWGRLGRFCFEKWNQAQIKGDVRELNSLIAAQKIFNYLSWFNFFFCTLHTLFQEDIDLVLDIQPLGTSPIMKAIRLYNYKMNKKVRLEKVLTDLPTKKATSYFGPIRSLTKSDLRFFKLISTEPLLEEGETKKSFWKKNCRLSEKYIQYEDYYVRQAFHQFLSKERSYEDQTLIIRTKYAKEMHLIQRICQKGSAPFEISGNEIRFQIAKQSLVATILLGSQPASEATLSYVKKWIHLAKEPNTLKTHLYLFVFCAEYLPQKETLFRKIGDMLLRTKNFPSKLSVIPFSFQDDDTIAPLYYRSNLTCTRSGGITSMELMCIKPPEIWIHSCAKESKARELTTEDLLNGIPGWEADNARYLMTFKQAKIVTPEIFAPLARKFLKQSLQEKECSDKLIDFTPKKTALI